MESDRKKQPQILLLILSALVPKRKIITNVFLMFKFTENLIYYDSDTEKLFYPSKEDISFSART